MGLSSYDPWERIASGGQGAFVTRYLELFDSFLTRKKGESYDALRSANKRERKLQFAEGEEASTVTCSESPSSSVVGSSTPVSPGKARVYSVSLLSRKKKTAVETGQTASSSKVPSRKPSRKATSAKSKKQ